MVYSRGLNSDPDISSNLNMDPEPFIQFTRLCCIFWFLLIKKCTVPFTVLANFTHKVFYVSSRYISAGSEEIKLGSGSGKITCIWFSLIRIRHTDVKVFNNFS